MQESRHCCGHGHASLIRLPMVREQSVQQAAWLRGLVPDTTALCQTWKSTKAPRMRIPCAACLGLEPQAPLRTAGLHQQQRRLVSRRRVVPWLEAAAEAGPYTSIYPPGSPGRDRRLCVSTALRQTGEGGGRSAGDPCGGGDGVSKLVTFVRHGQATHNPRAEAARKAGCSFDRFLELMHEDDEFDAALTSLGWEQARRACDVLAAAAEKAGVGEDGGAAVRPPIEAVVVSPLSRAIDTARTVFPKETDGGAAAFVCIEAWRERNGWLLNAKRRRQSELRGLYPPCDFSDLCGEEDTLWTPELESVEDCKQRAGEALAAVWDRPEGHIAVVAHGGILHTVLNDHPQVHACPASKPRFSNCEVRTCRIEQPRPGTYKVSLWQ